MIDIKEIRVGNCFNLKNKKEIVFIDSILSLDKEISYSTWNDEEYGYADISYLLPILITEDLLFKLGFEKKYQDLLHGYYYYRLEIDNFCIDINILSNTKGRNYGIHIDNSSFDSVLCGDIQYLHQLQNYIYDSTHQELYVSMLLKK